MSNYEKQYIKICKNVLKEGYFDTNRTGMSTYKLPHQIITVDLQKEFPILKSKFVAFKTCVKEILWIMQGNNNVKDLKSQNCHVWDEWEMEDGTIGTAYGWIVKNYNQIDNLINQLKTNPQDRRMMINLWQWDFLETGALAPCCFCSMWDVTDGKLNCMLIQRSGDLPLGVPFNTTQYAVLTHVLAKICGLEVGNLTHVINNAHIYKNQIDGIKKQLYCNFKELEDYEKYPKILFKFDLLRTKDEKSKILESINYIPQLQLNIKGKEFKDITADDLSLNGYSVKYGNMGKIDMPVSV
ncbi:thymidylate synthase [Clostridium botulinum]|nr:thymidylate synthase [Clostridium botulinum]